MMKKRTIVYIDGFNLYIRHVESSIEDEVVRGIASYKRAWEILDRLVVGRPFLVLADAYYGYWKMARGCLKRGAHLLTRVKSNAVACLQPVAVPGRRGRKPTYGKKVRLRDTFKEKDGWAESDVELYGDRHPRIEELHENRFEVRRIFVLAQAGHHVDEFMLCRIER